LIKEIFLSLLKQYGNPVLFIGLAAEYIGFPFVPGEAMMSFLGFSSVKESAGAVLYSLLFAVAGTFTGSMLAWLIGYKYGEGVVLKVGKPFRITKKKLDAAKVSFDKRRTVWIVFSRFIPGIRHIIPYLSGISRIKAGKFALLSLAGSVLWCGSFIGLGSLLGERWRMVANLAKAYSLVILLLVIFVLLTMKYFKNHKRIIFAITFPVLLFIKISEDIIKQELSVFDNNIYKFVASFITEDMTDFMKFLSIMGSGLVLIIITLVIIMVVRKNKKYFFFALMVGANLLASSIINEVFKIIFHRERPDILRMVDITGFSFPSGHSMIGFCFYGYIAYFLWSNWRSVWRYAAVFILSALILSIGISRIYLGVHYASDVLGGFSAGLAWLPVFITVSNRMYKTYNSKSQV